MNSQSKQSKPLIDNDTEMQNIVKIVSDPAIDNKINEDAKMPVPNTASDVKNKASSKAIHFILALGTDEKASVSLRNFVQNNPTILLTNNDAIPKSRIQTTETTMNGLLKKRFFA